MTIKRQKIKVDSLGTIDWYKDKIIDWANAGTTYSLDGQRQQLNKYSFAFKFDSAISSKDGTYSFIYKRLGTKGLLLKNGEILREINRSYYCADIYEYPAAFISVGHNKTYLAHCPFEYCRLDFEDVETGKIVTDTPDRKPKDMFHSRLEVSQDNRYLISKGWVWHPLDTLELYEVNACIDNPLLLDKGITLPGTLAEICSASFIDNDSILVCASDELLDDENPGSVLPGHIAIWNISNNTVSKSVKIEEEHGNIIAIDKDYCWDIYKYPKLIDINTGKVIETFQDIQTGLQKSSIIQNIKDELPLVAYNKRLKGLAIKNNDSIEILTVG
ncbi:MAG: hypothetical protein QY309_13315 [Cyclobacteriaceae bacterium]|nr:MAG: hypothetical protein QY309_13315 [Cyclobacteriaceae bacterium]